MGIVGKALAAPPPTAAPVSLPTLMALPKRTELGKAGGSTGTAFSSQRNQHRRRLHGRRRRRRPQDSAKHEAGDGLDLIDDLVRSIYLNGRVGGGVLIMGRRVEGAECIASIVNY